MIFWLWLEKNVSVVFTNYTDPTCNNKGTLQNLNRIVSFLADMWNQKPPQTRSIPSTTPHFIHFTFNIKLPTFSVFFSCQHHSYQLQISKPLKKKLTSMRKCTTPTICCFHVWTTKEMWINVKPNVTLGALSRCRKLVSR